jgi:hypothetical protein
VKVATVVVFEHVYYPYIEFAIAGDRWASTLRANQRDDIPSCAGLRLCGRFTSLLPLQASSGLCLREPIRDTCAPPSR